VALRKKERTCRREFARAFLLNTPRPLTDEYGNVRKDSMLSNFFKKNGNLQQNVGGKLLQYYSPTGKDKDEERKLDDDDRCCDACLVS